jgi:hypothetical protein
VAVCRRVRKVRLSIRLFVCMEHFGSHYTDFHNIWYKTIFRKSVEKIKVLIQNGQEYRETLYKGLGKFTVKRFWILLRLKNILGKICTENQNIFWVQFFFSENCAIMRKCENMWWRLSGHRWQCNTALKSFGLCAG